MGVTPRSKLLPWLGASIAVVLGGLVWILSSREENREPAPPTQTVRKAFSPPVSIPPDNPSRPVAPQAALPPARDTSPDAGPLASNPSSEQTGEHPVNLERLREELPNNLYWELGAPTTDPEVLRRREEEVARWDALFGKVQSNTASEAEIHQYYEHRRAVSEDFIAFATRVLDEYGPQLPEQERGLYELSIQMHRTRLEEIPRQVDDALARKALQDQRREAWRRGGGGP